MDTPHRPGLFHKGFVWQICLAHQLRDCQYAIEAGDAVFAPRMKALLLRAVLIARRHRDFGESTRREYRRRLEETLDIPRSHNNPELLWIDDSEIVRDLITVGAPVPGHVIAQEVQHCGAEILERGVA